MISLIKLLFLAFYNICQNTQNSVQARIYWGSRAFSAGDGSQPTGGIYPQISARTNETAPLHAIADFFCDTNLKKKLSRALLR